MGAPNLAGIRTIGQRGLSCVDEEMANWGRVGDSIPAICYGKGLEDVLAYCLVCVRVR